MLLAPGLNKLGENRCENLKSSGNLLPAGGTGLAKRGVVGDLTFTTFLGLLPHFQESGSGEKL